MANTEKGRDFVLSVSIDDGATFLPAAGIKSKEFTRENPVADTTSQSTTGNETHSCYTGYSTVTMSGNGVTDKTDTTVYPYADLATAANSATPTLLCRLEDSTGETYEGSFHITSFGKTADQNGIVEFSIAMQNAEDVTFTAAT